MYPGPAQLARQKVCSCAELAVVWGKKHSQTPSVESVLVKICLKGNFTVSIRIKNYTLMRANLF